MKTKQFERWSKIRAKGQLSYVITQSLILLFGMLIGHLIAFYVDNYDIKLSLFFYNKMPIIIFTVVFTPFFALILWYIQEAKFNKESRLRTSK
ncbi:hypothetical protein [Photobacterium kishitanii]|uniref:hypothetical protein n=1 Tax=Photobacterium kishitanii TaxID=318456 RepID=UPI00071AEB52|nr:hypothetical protein [Photobacterium kishitanii]